MERFPLRRVVGTDADGILDALSTRQHLAPHRKLKDVLADIGDNTGLCPRAAERAMAWLNLGPELPVGRLRRGELIQLARSVYRFWCQAVAARPTPSGPTP